MGNAGHNWSPCSSVQEEKQLNSPERLTSTWVAGWNVVNMIQGIGMLGIPYAIKMGGWIGLMFLGVFGALCCFTGELLIDCLYDEDEAERQPLVLSGRPRRYQSFMCLGEAVWPRYGRHLVNTLALVELYGVLVLDLILMSTTSRAFLNELTIQHQIPVSYCSLVVTYALLPLLFVRHLRVISLVTLVAVLGLMATTGLVLAFCLTQLESADLTRIPDFNPITLPTGCGIIIFSYCAHPLLPSIEASMRHPHHYPRMMRSAFAFTTLLKVFMGLLAVMLFGPQTDQDIANNLASGGPRWNLAASVLLFFSVFFSVPLVVYCLADILDRVLLPHFHPSLQLQPGGRWALVWTGLTRAILLSAGLLTVILVPHFGLVMGVIGSCTGTLLAFVFPPWFHIVLKGRRLTRWAVAQRLGVIAFGICGGVLGLGLSLRQIVTEQLREE